MKRRLFQGLLIAALLCGAVLLAHPTAAWADITGTGTSKDPYQIGSAADLKEFANKVNSDETTANAVLTTDFTLTDANWTPIGKDNNHMYNGTFDGAGHTIYGLQCSVSSGDVAGLFGVIGSNGVVKNVGIADSKVSVEVSATDQYVYAGGVCGYSAGTVENCWNSGSVTATNSSESETNAAYAGGVCGYSAGTVENCWNSGIVTGSSSKYVGGICGYSVGTVENCWNSSTVTGSSDYVGGICGKSSDGTISNCSNSGDVRDDVSDTVTGSSSKYVGGICGKSSDGSISNCSNSGNVIVNGSVSVSVDVSVSVTDPGSVISVGGICGGSTGSDTITGCSNSGDVSVDGSVSVDVSVSVTDPGSVISVGGICGGSTGSDTITGCSNSGDVSVNVSVTDSVDVSVSVTDPDSVIYVGGICGYSSVSISDCSNSGDVSVDVSVSDPVGDSYPDSFIYVGGFCGYSNGSSISDCSNSGTVRDICRDPLSTLAVGGFCGWNQAHLSNCYWLEDTASEGAGGGASDTISKTDDEYASGEVAWLLNQGRTDGPWRQTLGEDKFPTLDSAHGVVIKVTVKDETDTTGTDYYGNGNHVALPAPGSNKAYFDDNNAYVDPESHSFSDGEIIYLKDAVKVTVVYGNGASDSVTYFVSNTSGNSFQLPSAPVRAGYTFGGWSDGEGNTSQPKDTVTITADTTFTAIWTAVPSGPSTYQIVLDSDITGGTVTASPRWAARGDTVYLTVTADEGYELSTLSVSDRNGDAVTLNNEGGGVYSFTMPIGRVTVTATFDKAVITLPFTDVQEGDWFYDPVCFVYENGLMTGTSATTFEPNTPLSRAMLVAVLHRLEGSPAASGGDFTDVADGDWYAEAVNWAASVGVVNGMGDGSFQPNAAITREQMAAILRNYAAYKGMDVTTSGDLSTYSDATSVSSWAEDSVAWAVEQGLISGMSIDTLQPQGLSTRAQVAAVLQRYLAK